MRDLTREIEKLIETNPEFPISKLAMNSFQYKLAMLMAANQPDTIDDFQDVIHGLWYALSSTVLVLTNADIYKAQNLLSKLVDEMDSKEAKLRIARMVKYATTIEKQKRV